MIEITIEGLLTCDNIQKSFLKLGGVNNFVYSLFLDK